MICAANQFSLCDAEAENPLVSFADSSPDRGAKGCMEYENNRPGDPGRFCCYFALSCQNATALAAATLRESTPWDMGIMTV